MKQYETLSELTKNNKIAPQITKNNEKRITVTNCGVENKVVLKLNRTKHYQKL